MFSRKSIYKFLLGDDLVQYVEVLGWTIDPTTNVAIIPPNPDNQIEATVVQEAIKLPRKSTLMLSVKGLLKFSFRTDKNHRTLQKLVLYTVVSTGHCKTCRS